MTKFRVVDVPADFANALGEDAKKPETRVRRIGKTLTSLREDA